MKSYVIIAALSGSIFTQGQQAGAGSAAAAGGPAAAAGTVAPSTISPTPSQPAAIANPRGVGSSSISTPGAGSTIGLGAANNAALAGGRGVAFSTLPAAVQSSLRTQAAGMQVGTVTQLMTPSGPVYAASVVRNGTPTMIAVQANGTILNPQSIASLQPGTTVLSPSGANTTVTPTGTLAPTAPGTATASGLATAQAGLPISALPAGVQAALRTQLAGGTVQTVSRDDTANGPLYRVTVNQNGVPTELQFAANGALLGRTALNNSLTSPSGAVVGTVPPAAVIVDENARSAAEGAAAGTQIGAGRFQGQGTINTSTNIVVPQTNARTNKTSLRITDLPDSVAQTLKAQAPDADIRTIFRDETPSGGSYRVAFRANDKFGELVINEEGKVIRDSRDIPVVVISRDTAATEAQTRTLEFARLPVAVRNAVKAYASPAEVRSVQLGRNREGKTVYDIVIYNDGKRDRLEIGKDGTVNKYFANVSSAAEAPSDKPPVIAIGDLPVEVQDTIRQQTDTVRIEEISSTILNGETVYQVKWQTNGAPVELMVGTDGALIYPAGAASTDTNGEEKAPTPLPDEDQKEVVKAVDASPAPAASGAPAAISSENSKPVEVPPSVTSTNGIELKGVSLEDVPESVQNTVKKLGGSSVVQSIAPKVEESGIVYEVTFLQNGTKKSMVLNKDGTINADKAKE